MIKRLGVIGGSGLYDMPGLESVDHLTVQTPFGEPSGPIQRGRLGQVELYFLARHGQGHRLLPSEINYRANMHVWRQLGVEHVLSVSAVGSLQKHLAPGTLVLPKQFIDRTFKRSNSFYGEGAAGHVSLADPVCHVFQDVVVRAAQGAKVSVQQGGTYVCIEGPQFSTRAESLLYQSFGADIIGMTNMPEAKLAREAGLSYVTLALVTDMDAWLVHEAPVTLDTVMATLRANIEQARRVIGALCETFSLERSPFRGEFSRGLVTRVEDIPQKTRETLKVLLSDGNVS